MKSLWTSLKNQRGALLLTAVVVMTIAAPVLYTMGRMVDHYRPQVAGVQERVMDGEEVPMEETQRSRDALPEVGRILQAHGGLLNAATAVNPGSSVGDALGTGVATVSDVVISESVSRGSAPPATSSNPLPADVAQTSSSCGSTSLASCGSRSSCSTAGGYWHANSTCNATPEPGCNLGELSLCTTQTSCSGVGGYWYDGLCNSEPEDVCSADNLGLCSSAGDCSGAGGHWYDGQCNAEPDQVCSADDLTLCSSAGDCDGAGGYWYDQQCNLSPADCYAGSPELCANENDCYNADAYWYNDSCNAEPEGGLVSVAITSPAQGTETAENQVTVTAQYAVNVPGTQVVAVGFLVNGAPQQASLSDETFSTTAVLTTGDNQIAATVTSAAGDTYTSAPITVISDATNNRYHIRITWDKDDTDVDLHFNWSGGSECYYSNETPNWGSPETSPRLDVDDRNGYGPENITIDSLPGPGQYDIFVDYYSDHDNGGTNVNATIYENGVSIFSGSRYMTDGETWSLTSFSL